MRKLTVQFGLVVLLLAIVFVPYLSNWMSPGVVAQVEAAGAAPPLNQQAQRSTGMDANHALSVLIWAQIGDGVWTVTNGMEMIAIQLPRAPKTQTRVFAVRTRMQGTETWTNGRSFDRAGAAITAIQSAGSVQSFKKFIDGHVID